MWTSLAPRRKLFGGLVAVSLACVLAACSPIPVSGVDDADDTGADVELAEVEARFAAMTEVPGDPAGATVVESAGAATVWALTRRDDVRRVDPVDCSLDGVPMERAAEALNVPEPRGLEAAGRPQTLFAFASAAVDQAGSFTVACDLGGAPVLLLLLEPDD
ncbi:hypothetical protein JN535_00165 [Cellulosimicrobium cellulans]|uniref:hypothetical protein n=1 Tax=Cellulosimicrobium cellulans TaxID=1710 RepID=UPI0019632AC8|nr:hypothetical protein [Cellulosimicrobium cellulans]MBN0038587.1 hypothetical protein [Cellulosimicrobium cellulans]